MRRKRVRETCPPETAPRCLALDGRRGSLSGGEHWKRARLGGREIMGVIFGYVKPEMLLEM